MNQELIKDYNFKKKFGQNFLKDENILRNIITKSEVDKDTLVIEIGIGAAYLTYYLSETSKNVLGYEIDETLKDIIDEQLKDKDNVEIIYNDFLKTNPIDDIKKYDFKKLYVIANLPYYITTPIITKLIEDKLPIEKIVVMVQKEVGDRFNAKPNSKEYNSLTIFLNYYFEIRKLMDVSRNSFVPKPNVDSAIIEFKRVNKYKANNEELFFKIVRDSFKFKRKNLRNNLKGYDLDKINIILNKIGKDLTVRAEALTIDDFIFISNNYEED
ncbi:MAG: ribosomal RNA small subunit methyltransferase A [Bacilli bacterium]|nr:ribosomal RNA small subunit methyltransferase A [Bacilli bacterium]